MNENQLIEQQRKEARGRIAMTKPEQSEPIEASQIVHHDADEFEYTQGVPYIATLFGLNDDYRIDAGIKSKIDEVNAFVKSRLFLENKRNTLISYRSIIENLLRSGIESHEMDIRAGRGLRLLEKVFQNIAILHGLSGESYAKNVKERQARVKVETLKGQLREAIKNLT